MSTPEPRWQFGPPLDCFDRGFQFGDGVFETIDYQLGGAWLLDQHRTRLWTSLERLGLLWPEGTETERLLQAVEARAASVPRAIVKLFLSAAPTQHGYGRSWPHPALLRASVTRREPTQAGPARIAMVTESPGAATIVGGLKHLNRLPQVLQSSRLASTEADEESFDEYLVCDSGGRIEEGTYTNFFYQRSGQYFTPPISFGVKGTLRAALLAAPEFVFAERPLTPQDLPGIDRCWIGNSVAGLRPVVQLTYGQQRIDYPVSESADQLVQWCRNSQQRDRQPLVALGLGANSTATARASRDARAPREDS